MDKDFIHEAVEVLYMCEHLFSWKHPQTEHKKWCFCGTSICHLLLGFAKLIIISVLCGGWVMNILMPDEDDNLLIVFRRVMLRWYEDSP